MAGAASYLSPRAIFVAVTLGASVSGAVVERAPSSPGELRAIATHIVTGTVESVTATRELEGKWEFLRFHALVHVQAVEKGAGLETGDTIGCRFWTRTWILPTSAPDTLYGHEPLPHRGQSVRVYVVDRGYNGFDDTMDGGWDVVGRNGWELLSPALAGTGDEPPYDSLDSDWRKRAVFMLAAVFVAVIGLSWVIRNRKLKHA